MAITPQQLFTYARKPDLELRQEGQGQNQPIQTREGTLSGKIARHHKINHEDRTVKQGQYHNAKESVQQALIDMYGQDVGRRAFRANIGHMRGNQHVSSSDHPITGRHIRKMIDTAESLIKSDVQRLGKHSFHTRHDLPVTERGIAGWMQGWNPRYQDQTVKERINGVSTEPNHKFKIDDTVIDVRAQHVSRHKPSEEDRRAAAVNVAHDMLDDVHTFFQDNPQQRDGFWTLDVGLNRNVKGGHQHCIGIRMVRDGEPGSDMVHVFDANSREIKIPKDEFGGWLAMHLKDTYGEIETLDLYRAQQTLDGFPLFVRNDGKWDCEQKLDFLEEFRGFVAEDVKKEPVRGAYPQFWRDLTRGVGVHVGQDGETPLRLTPDSAIREMTELVKLDGEHPEEDAKAVLALSSLMSQSFGNSIALTAGKLAGGVIEITDNARHDSRITRDGDKLRIEFTEEMPLRQLMVNGVVHQLSPETDFVEAKLTIEVSIAELRQAGEQGRAPNFVVVGEESAKLHVEGFSGPVPDWGHTKARNAKDVDGIEGAMALGVGVIDDGDWAKFERSIKDRVRDEPLVKFKDDGIGTTAHFWDLARGPLDLRIDGKPVKVSRPDRVQELLSDIPRVSIGDQAPLQDQPPPLDDQQTAQLTRLLDRYIIDDFCSLTARSLGATPNDIRNSLRTKQYGVDIVRSGEGDDEYLDIKLSQRVSTGSFLGNSDDDPLKMTLRIKVKLSDLTNGTPENFEVLERPKLELAPPIDVVNWHKDTVSWLLLANPGDQPPPQLGTVNRAPHQFSLDGGMIIDLHGEHVRSMPLHDSLIGENDFRSQSGIKVEQAVLGEINRYFNQNEDREDCYITVEINSTESAFGRSDHTLGIHAKRGDNGEILWFEFFDSNRNTVGGDRRIYQPEHWAGVLSQHIDTNYGHVERIDLYTARLEPRLMNVFVPNGDDTYKLDRTFDLPGDHTLFEQYDRELRIQAGLNMGSLDWDKVQRGPNGQVQLDPDTQQPIPLDDAIQLTHQFMADLGRENFIVLGQQRERVTIDRAGEQLTEFVGLDEPDPNLDKEAAKALSSLLTQTFGNAMVDKVVARIVSVEGGDPFSPSSDPKSMRLQRNFEVVRDGNDVLITFNLREPVWRWGTPDGTYQLNSDTDYVEASVTMRVSIEELRQAGQEGRVPDFSYDRRPNGSIHVENFQPDPDKMSERIEGRRNQTVEQAINLGVDLVGDERWNPFVDSMRSRIEHEQSTMRVRRDGVEIARNYLHLFPARQSQQDEGKLTVIVNGEAQPIDWQHPENAPNPLMVATNNNPNQAMQLSKLIDHSILQDIGFEAGLGLGATPEDGHRYQRDQFRVELTRVDDVDEPYIDVKLSQQMRLDQNSQSERIIQRGEDGAPPLPTRVSVTLRVKISDLQQGTPENFTVQEKPKLELAPPPPLNVGGGVNVDPDPENLVLQLDNPPPLPEVGNGGIVNPQNLVLQVDPNQEDQGFVIVNQ